jgi:hypothetical protein
MLPISSEQKRIANEKTTSPTGILPHPFPFLYLWSYIPVRLTLFPETDATDFSETLVTFSPKMMHLSKYPETGAADFSETLAKFSTKMLYLSKYPETGAADFSETLVTFSPKK